jgi:3-hydroxyacyl-[acyl-carrier-protein] dehydratase
MLLDNLYKIVSEDSVESSSEFTITIDPSHPIYLGHFPGFPVTPGVVELEIVRELAGKMLNGTLNLKKVSNCKFTYILNPQDVGELQVKINLVPKDNDFKVVAQILDSEHTYLIAKATYGLA